MMELVSNKKSIVGVILFITLLSNVQAQKTYLFYPFYGDEILFKGVSLNYINSHDVYKSSNTPLNYEYHGYSLGVVLNDNNLWYGLGLLWGLTFNLSMATPENSFNELVSADLSIYHSLHLSYKIPFSNDFAIGMHTGPGLNIGLLNVFYKGPNEENEFRSYKEKWYKRFDFSYDIALYLEYRKSRFEVSWSRGLTNNGDNINPFRRNRLMFGIIFFFYK